MNTHVRSLLLVVLFASFACGAFAQGEQNDFTAKVKAKAERTAEWTKAQCAKLKAEVDQAAANGSVKWQKFTEEASKKVDEKLGTHFARKQTEKLNEADLIQLKVPFEVPEYQKPSGSEPSKRSPIVTTEEVVIGDENVTMTSTTLPNDPAWFAWLDTEEGKMFAVGAIAVISIAGVTYVLYKNQVPQRIYGYVVKNPVRSLVATACLLGIAAYVARAHGVTLESIKAKFCVPTPA